MGADGGPSRASQSTSLPCPGPVLWNGPVTQVTVRQRPELLLELLKEGSLSPSLSDGLEVGGINPYRCYHMGRLPENGANKRKEEPKHGREI